MKKPMKNNTAQPAARFWRAVSFNTLKTLALLAAGGFVTQLAGGQCVLPPSGLVAWWSGDGTTDDWAQTNNGFLTNGATYATGLIGQAFSLNGVDSYVQAPAAATAACTTALSAAAWVWPASLSSNNDYGNTIVGQYNTSRGTVRWFVTLVGGGKVRFGVSKDGLAYGVSRAVDTQQAVVPPNTWTHVAATFDASI